MTEAEHIRVTNTRPTFLHLPDAVHQVGIKDKDGTLKDVRFNSTSGKSLIPGGNNVPRDQWERAKENRTVRDWLSIGWLVEGGDVTLREGPEPPKDLASYNVPAALLLIDGEDSGEALARWLSLEKRADVLTALRQHIQTVGVGLPKLPPLERGKRA